MSYWYQSPYNNRHPKIKEDTFARSKKDSSLNIKKGDLVLPVRWDYVPYDSWVKDEPFDKETQVVCYTEAYGYIIVKASAIDFSK